MGDVMVGGVNEEEKRVEGDEVLEQQRSNEVHLSHQDVLIKGADEQSRSFDKHLIALASGTIAVSLLLIERIDVVRDIENGCWLGTSWFFLVCSLISTLFSFLVARKAYDVEMDRWNSETEANEQSENKNCWRTCTWVLNSISFLTFVVGVAFLLLFAYSNFI